MVWLVLLLALTSACHRDRGGDQAYRQAAAAFRQGDLNRAADLAAAHASPNPDPNSPDDWRWRLLKAEVASARARPADALAILNHPAPARLPAIETRRQVALCYVHVRGGRMDAARAALETARRLRGAPSEVLLDADLCETSILARSGDAASAEQKSMALVAAAAAHGSDYHQAAALINLAFFEMQRSRYDIAADYGTRAVSAAGKANAKQLLAAASTNLATSLNRLGQFDRSLALLDRAISIERASGDRAWLVNSLAERGGAFYFQGDYSKAAVAFEEAHRAALELGNSAAAAKWAGNLANTYIELGRVDDAERWNRTAIELSGPESPAKAYHLSNSVEIWRLRGNSSRAFEECRRALANAGQNPELERSLHAQLASLHAMRGNLPAARREFESALSLIEEKQRNLSRDDFRIAFFARLVRHYQEYVDVLVDHGERDKALEVAERSRARVLANRLGLSGRAPAFDARALARQTQSVLLSYWLGSERSFVWAVTPERIYLEPLPARAEIESLVQTYDQAVARGEGLSDPAGRRLYEILVGPVRNHLKQNARVILVPDGPLHGLNFESLPVAGRHYWLEDVTLAIAPSLAVLDAAPATRPSAMLLIGAPEPAGPAYPGLPHVGREIESIRALFPGMRTAVYTGGQASPEAYFKTNPNEFSLIHFAAHGEANRESPLESAVILSPSPVGYKLYTRDVVSRPLSAALVTVSGCRSAGSRTYAGEGLIGFAWGFLQAGAQAVIAGLWDVSDSSTAELMQNLYQGIARGASPASSLRSAKLALIARGGSWRKPSYWAAFQIYVRRVEPQR